MKPRLVLTSFALGLTLGIGGFFAACGGSESGAAGTTGTPGGTGGQGTGGSGTGGGTGGSVSAQLIYVHSDTTLFTLDPTAQALALTPVGDFDCVGTGTGKTTTAMTDIAIDSDQNLWGVSATAIRPLTIEGTTVHCGQQTSMKIPAPGAPDGGADAGPPENLRFVALTFAPVGVLDPSKEVLVAGESGGGIWAIDGQNQITQHGTFGKVPAKDPQGNDYKYPGGEWEFAGDMVFLANGGAPVGFAALRDCPNPPDDSGCSSLSTLVELDLTKLKAEGTQVVLKKVIGQAVKGAACSDGVSGNYGSIYGIASWDTKIFGFSTGGNIVDLSLVDGSGCLVKAYPNDKFSGAGVTTKAPFKLP